MDLLGQPIAVGRFLKAIWFRLFFVAEVGFEYDSAEIFFSIFFEIFFIWFPRVGLGTKFKFLFNSLNSFCEKVFFDKFIT